METKIKLLLEELEACVGTDSFEYVMTEKMEEIEREGAGIETITPILQIMERHPLEDFGMPGEMVHFVEKFYRKGYEERLVESLKRRPASHTVWMLNRIINGSAEKEKYISLLDEITKNNDLEEEIRMRAQEYIDYQSNR